MRIGLNTEFCWPLAAVGPNKALRSINAVVELFEHAGLGVGDNVSNPAQLPAILLSAHVHAAANQAVITPASGSRCHGSGRWLWFPALLPPTPADLHAHAPRPVIATRTAQGAILVAALVEDEAAEALVHVRRRAVDGERSKAIRKPSEP